MRLHNCRFHLLLLSNVLSASSLGAIAACGDDKNAGGMPQETAGASAGAGTAGRGATAGSAAGVGGAMSTSGRGASGAGGRAGQAGAGQAGAGQAGAAGVDAGADDDAGAITAGTGAGGAGAGGAAAGGAGGASGASRLSFFVSSQKNMTGNLGGLAGADTRCQTLAAAVGAGDQAWHAYLSVAMDAANGNMPIHARDRIGTGPWFNAKGVMVAANLTELHARTGNADVFLDETGNKINGQWEGSPMPIEHDVLTGTTPEGMLMQGMTCEDWTSTSMATAAQVGHTDGLGPSRNGMPPYSSWNSSHANRGCGDTAPAGGAGRIYCFATGAMR
jgi:hypothetical protein